MTSSIDNGPLTDRDWVRLNQQCEALERAWREAEGDLVDLGRFLPPVEDPLRRRFLLELIKTELELRWWRNLPITLENYLERFRELGPIQTLPASLIYEEYRTRHLYGDRPQLESYRDRFTPAQFEELQQLLDEQPLPVRYSTLQPPAPDDTLGLSPPPSPPSQTPPLPRTEPVGDQIISNEGYTLGPKIGSGQFGVVFRATAPGGIPVAVKRILRPLSDEMGKRELRALELLSQLRHPALLSIHTFWQFQDRLIIVMELADDSLADRLKECKKAGHEGIPPNELIAYFGEAAETLDYLHSQNLMHRDIKPANLLRLKGHAKVADFGLVRLQTQRLESTVIGGTPLYMAPECFRGHVSVHSDQYSLAVTYAEMRLGRRIYRSTNVLDLALEHDKGTPDLCGLDESERRVLLRALAKKPDNRYPSCHEFVHALSEAVLHRPSPAARHSLTARALIATILALLLLLGIFHVIYVQLFISGKDKQENPHDSREDPLVELRRAEVRHEVESLRHRPPTLISAHPSAFQEVENLPSPDYSAFEILSDERVVDLRGWKRVPPERSAELLSASSMIRRIRLRKIQRAEEIRFEARTTGAEVCMHCLSHPAAYRVLAQKSPGFVGANRTRVRQMIVDVRNIPLQTEFTVQMVLTYWNSLQNEDDLWFGAMGYESSFVVSLLIIYPLDRPFKDYELKVAPTTEQKPFAYQDRKILLVSERRDWVYWEIPKPKAGYVYLLYWTW